VTVRLYTVHGEPPRKAEGPEGWPEPKGRPPVLLRDGFSVHPVLFGVLWFVAQRLWIEAGAMLALTVAAVLLLPDPHAAAAVLALHVIAGFEGRDRQRARLARRGMPELAVVAAPDMDLAWFRLAAQRPDLVKAPP
jgi:hypothetical protein